MTTNPTLLVASTADWREWLDGHHDTDHGRALVEPVKTTGTWQVLPDEGATVPADFQELLDRNTAARNDF